MAVGGSIESVSIKGREFPVAADADASQKLGGKENENQMNGNGTARLIKTTVPWSITGIVASIDDTRGDQQFLQEIADSLEYVPMSVTYASGVTVQGTGQITGELVFSSQASTVTLEIGGPGKLTAQ